VACVAAGCDFTTPVAALLTRHMAREHAHIPRAERAMQVKELFAAVKLKNAVKLENADSTFDD